MLHVYCSKLSDEKWYKVRSAAVGGGKSKWVIISTEKSKIAKALNT